MKKMNLMKGLEAAKVHSEQQQTNFVSPAARPSKSELAARVETGITGQRASSVQPPKAKPKAKPIKRVQSIREIFSYSSDDAARLLRLIQRAARLGTLSNKSEVVRAGLLALDKMTDDQLATVLKTVPRMKPGRPKQTAEQV